MTDKTYRIFVDGFVIKTITLTPEQYGTQKARDCVRSALAEDYCIPRHYIRMKEFLRKEMK